MAFTASYLYQLRDKMTPVLKKIKKANDSLSKSVVKNGRKMAESFKRVGKRMKDAGKSMMVGGASIVAPLTLGLKKAHEFNKKIAEIATLVPKMGLKKVEKQFGDLAFTISNKYGIATTDVLEGMYQAISAGVEPTKKALETFLSTSAQSAVGGVSTITEAVDGITSVLNAYGKETISTTEIVDSMFTAMKAGKTTIPEISQFLFQAVPVASKLGISFDEVMGSLVTITKQGAPTRIAMSRISRAFDELSTTGGKVDKVFRAVAGKSFIEFKKEGGTVQQAMQMIADAATKAKVPVKDLFNSKEAAEYAMFLSGVGAKHFAGAMDDLKVKAGAGKQAFEEFAGSDAFKVTKSLNKLGNTFKKVFLPFLKVVGRVAKALDPAIDKMSKFMEENKTLATVLLSVTMVAGILLTILGAIGFVSGAVIAGIGALTTGFIAVAGALGLSTLSFTAFTASVWASTLALLANPITWIVLAVIAVGVAIYKLVTHWDAVKVSIGNAVDWIVKKWNKWKGLITLIGIIVFPALIPIIIIAKLAVKHWDKVRSVTKGYKNDLEVIRQYLVTEYGPAWDNYWKRFDEGLTYMGQDIMEFIDKIGRAFDFVEGKARSFLEFLGVDLPDIEVAQKIIGNGRSADYFDAGQGQSRPVGDSTASTSRAVDVNVSNDVGGVLEIKVTGAGKAKMTSNKPNGNLGFQVQ